MTRIIGRSLCQILSVQYTPFSSNIKKLAAGKTKSKESVPDPGGVLLLLKIFWMKYFIMVKKVLMPKSSY